MLLQLQECLEVDWPLMVRRHGWECLRHRGNVGGVVETRHGASSRVLLGSRYSVLAARPSGIVRRSSMLDDVGEVERPFEEKASASN